MDASQLSLVGGHPALDFANTVWWHESEAPVEWLRSYEELLAWAVHADVLPPERAARLRRTADVHPVRAARITTRARDLRECLFRLFGAAARSEPLAPADLEILNGHLRRALPHLSLAPADPDVGAGETQVQWRWDEEDLSLPLWIVAWAAARLLESEDLSRVGMCAGNPCGWLFLDRSRNRSRRWCDMGDCGNRAKARRHYARNRENSKRQSSAEE